MPTRTESRDVQIIFGVSAGVFKFNRTGSPHRKRRKVSVLHIAPTVKPAVATATHFFTLLTPMASIEAGAFLYKEPGDYLTITNPIDLEITLVVDPSGNGYVTTAAQSSEHHAALATSTFL